MKITFIIPYAGMAGGIRVIAIYAERLQARGHEVSVISRPKQIPTFKQKIKSLLTQQKWLRKPKVDPSHFDNLPVSHYVIKTFRPITDKDVPDADIVIATYWTTANWVNNLSPNKGRKVYFIQGMEADFPDLPAEKVRTTYKLPLKKITISKTLLKWLKDKTDDDTDIAMIFNSVDTEKFNAAPRTRQKRPTIGLLYSPSPIKGCDISLEAISKVKKLYPNLQLVAFGTDPVSPDLPLPENSTYTQLPPQETIRKIYAQCDLWICGSRMEGFHLPPLEAMACRCPVVSTEIGGPLDIIKNGINGYLAPIGDSNKLAEAIQTVLALSDAEWLKMSDMAHQTAHSYTWDDATSLFEECLHKINTHGQGL